jgi:hypothetical protein
MDLIAYGGVIRRQAIVVIVGMTIALALALLAVARVTTHGLEYRAKPMYGARSTLFVTQQGFPWGRTELSEVAGGVEGPRFGDPGRMEYLASLYSTLAQTSRTVQAEIERQGKLPPGAYTVTPVKSNADLRPLPLIEVLGMSPWPEQAVLFANQVADGLRRYVRLNQDASSVPRVQRIQLPVVTRARTAEKLRGVKMTRPILILMLVSILTLVVAFTRDNLRRPPKPRSADENLEMLEATPRVAVVEEQRPAAHGWDQQQVADRSSR